MLHHILPPGRPRALAGAVSRALLLTSLGLAIVPGHADAADAADTVNATARQTYNIAPGALDSVLNRYADQAGILLASDAQLTAGKTCLLYTSPSPRD